MQAQGGDFLKMSQGEQASVGVPHEQEETGKKKSVVGKVKDKAKKLSHKIKPKSKKNKDEHGNDVEGGTSSSSSEGEQEELPQQHQEGTGYQPTPEAGYDGAVHGGDYKSKDLDLSQEKKEEGGDYKSRDFDLSQDKKEEGGGLLSGDTHGYADPSAPAPGSNWPRGDEAAQQEVPAAPGQESSGISSNLSSGLGSDTGSRDPDSSSLAAGALAGKTEEKIPEGIMKPTSGSQEEEPKPVVEGVDSSTGRDLLSSQVKEGDPSNPIDKELKPSDSQKGWMQRASESVKSVFMGSPKGSSTPTDPTAPAPAEETTTQDKSWTEKARDAAITAKDTAASKLPSSTSPQDETAAAGTTTTETEAKPGITTRAVDSATALKDTVASKLGYGETGSATTPSTTDTLVGETDPTKQTPQGGITQKMVGVKDSVASKLGYGAGSEGATKGVEGGEKNSKLFTPDDDDTALSQKITDMLTLGGGSKSPTKGTSDIPAKGTSDTPASPGVMDRVTGAMGSLLGKKQPEEKGVTDTSAGTKDTTMSEATS